MVGELIGGRYRIEREIGRGGFGAVYVAVQEDLGRRVALKLLLRKHTTWVGFERFQREAQLAQHLAHPNTVRLFDFGMHDETPFIVFELLNGESLAGLIRRTGPLPQPQIVHIASQILKSLMEAHGLGIIHRDIKPANVLICAYAGEPDFVKVLDFGIAKSVESESVQLTATGESIGTPSYMSPEQLSGGSLSPASDIYAVGLVIAEMIAGTRVLGGNAMEAAMRQLDPNPLPFPEAVRQSPLWPIVERATRKDPSQRFASTSEMLTALAAYGPIAASVPPPPPSFAQTLPASGTVPAYGPYSGTAIASTETGTVPYAQASASVPPPTRKAGAFLALGGAVFVLGAAVLLVIIGLLAAFFIDWGSLGETSATSPSPDAGTQQVAAREPDGAPVASTDRTPGGSRPVAGGPVPSGTTPIGVSTPPTAVAPTGGSTFGKQCSSNADCKGAHETCAAGGICQCKSSPNDWNAPRNCGGVCVTNTDPNNCGACGKRCADTDICTTNLGGSIEHPICIACTKTSSSVRLLCGPHHCVAPNDDPRNCGACDKKCAPGQDCDNGVCK